MEQEYSNETLGVMLKDLKDVVEKGFAGLRFFKPSFFISFNRFPIIPTFMPLKGVRCFSFSFFSHIVGYMARFAELPIIVYVMRMFKTLFKRPVKFKAFLGAFNIFAFISFTIIFHKPIVNRFIRCIITFPHRVIFAFKGLLIPIISAVKRAKFSGVSPGWEYLKNIRTCFACDVNHNLIIL